MKVRSNRTKENDSAKVAANVNEEMSVGSWRGVLEGVMEFGSGCG